MPQRITLEETLRERSQTAPGREIAATILGLAKAAVELGDLVAHGRLAGNLAASSGRETGGGDSQKRLDKIADDSFIRCFRELPVACVASEEDDELVILDQSAPLALAIDPLDGSSNIDTNVSIGTIFSILPAKPADSSSPVDAFLQPGSSQLAAGFVVYGPQTTLVLAFGHLEIFVLDRAAGQFVRVAVAPTIAREANEYAINASNYRHWNEAVRGYVDDCVRGADGPLHKDFNMRWIASVVAEAYRILARGGVYLYPADRRKGYEQGRLRLVYEANPLAYVIELAGGAATDGVHRILDLRPQSLHQRTPLVFGAVEEVQRVADYYTRYNYSAERSPLFAPPGLLHA